MANSLWIDTSGAYCSLGLKVSEREFVSAEYLNRAHNQKLLSALDALFKQAQLKPRALDVVGFACGPGSFTGVRMAASAVQAIATAANCEVVPVTTSRALFESFELKENVVCSIKSRGDAYYLCQPDSDHELYDTRPDWVTGRESLVGERPNWWPDHSESGPEVAVMHSDPSLLVRYVERELQRGAGKSPELALPLYFSGDSPWKKIKGKKVKGKNG